MSEQDQLRAILDDGMQARKDSSTSFANGLAIFGVIASAIVLIKDPSAWWIVLCTAPLCLLALMPKGRHDDAIRTAVLEEPDEVVEITHHRGKPTVRASGMRGVTAAAIRNASREVHYVWIVTRGGARAAMHFDQRSSTRALEALAARCPHVAIEYGLPKALAGLVVAPEQAS